MEPVLANAVSLRHASRKRATLLFCVLTLAAMSGCTTGSRATSDAFRLFLNRNVEATAEQVASIPYPQLQLKANDLSSVAVLGHVDDLRLAWYAGSKAIFYTTPNGLLTGTAGLSRTYETRIVGDSPFDNLNMVTGVAEVRREFDWLPAYELGAEVNGRLMRKREESVEILGRSMKLIRFEEHLTGAGLNETNIYWADPRTGFIWKSKQYLAPGYSVDLIQLKPYRPSRK